MKTRLKSVIFPKPETVQFQSHEAAVEAITSFDFFPDSLPNPKIEGWIVVRIDEKLGIVEARFCPAHKGNEPLPAILTKDGKWVLPELQGDDYDLGNQKVPYADLQETLKTWRERYPDCLVKQLSRPLFPKDYTPYEFLQLQLTSTEAYFSELREMRSKAIPWAHHDFLDCEAALAGFVKHGKFFHFLRYDARDQLRSAARAGRSEEEILEAERLVKKLRQTNYDAADQYRSAHYSKDVKTAGFERMKKECPGFSDWVYAGAFDDGFNASR